MSAALERARMLYLQERYDLALAELTQALSEDPNDSEPKALLALTLSQLDRKKEALEMAQKAIAAEPDHPYTHYVMAVVQARAGKTKLAEQSALEAIRLHPEEAEYHTLLAALYAKQTRWRLSLGSADTALSYEPDNAEANALRAQALTMLGIRDEAKAAAYRAISEEPDSAYAHRSAGYVYWTQGNHLEALKHFKEALRLDPEDDAAREGLLEALRSKYAPYRWMIGVYVWLQRFPEGLRWGLIIGAFLLTRILRTIGKENPALMPYILPIVVTYSIFVWFTWIAEPIINVLLLMHPIGRYALSRQERGESYLIAGLLASSAMIILLSIPFSWRGAWAAVGPAVAVVIVSLATHIDSLPKLRSALVYGVGGLGFLISWAIAIDQMLRH